MGLHIKLGGKINKGKNSTSNLWHCCNHFVHPTFLTAIKPWQWPCGLENQCLQNFMAMPPETKASGRSGAMSYLQSKYTGSGGAGLSGNTSVGASKKRCFFWMVFCASFF